MNQNDAPREHPYQGRRGWALKIKFILLGSYDMLIVPQQEVFNRLANQISDISRGY